MSGEPREDGVFRLPSVNAERMKALSILVEDSNPIHVSAAAAAAAGLGDRVINPGSANLGYVLNALLALDPAARIERVSLSLHGNVRAEDEVVATARVDDEEPAADRRSRLRCSVALDVTGGPRALEGSAVVSLPAD